MITDLKTIEHCTLHASDGDIGKVRDFYFDDQHWHLRYFVVETGAWLQSRRVLISPEAVGTPAWDRKALPVSLSIEQVRNSPSIDTAKPVERQHETELRNYYGWPPYWGMLYGDAGAGLPVTPIEPSPRPAHGARKEEGDPHLHSAGHVAGFHIEATDGRIGHVENYLIDDHDWAIRYLVVDTRNWWPGRKVLLSPGWIRAFKPVESLVCVDLSSAAIKGSPAYDPSLPLTAAYTSQLHDYYNRPRYPDWDPSPDDPSTRGSYGV